MDSDCPPERWSPLDIPGWFLGLWPALKERLHCWLHKDRPECPACAKKDRQASVLWTLADEWANECLRLETLLAAEQAKREVAPGTPVLGGGEEGGISWTGLATRATREPNLEEIVANMTGPPKAATPELAKELRTQRECEAAAHLSYARVVAMQVKKGEGIIDPATMRDVRGRAEEGRTWYPDGSLVKALCHHPDGKPAPTTAEISARAQEMVDARNTAKEPVALTRSAMAASIAAQIEGGIYGREVRDP